MRAHSFLVTTWYPGMGTSLRLPDGRTLCGDGLIGLGALGEEVTQGHPDHPGRGADDPHPWAPESSGPSQTRYWRGSWPVERLIAYDAACGRLGDDIRLRGAPGALAEGVESQRANWVPAQIAQEVVSDLTAAFRRSGIPLTGLSA